MYVYVYIYVHAFIYIYIHTYVSQLHLMKKSHYGVAWVSRIDKIIGLFCKRAL